MILITTSRRPSPRTRSLCNELAVLIPNSRRINRGKMNNGGLLTYASAKGARTLVVIDSHMGNPSTISFISIQRDCQGGASLELRIVGVKLRRELMSEIEIHRAKKLVVLKGRSVAGLEQFNRTLAGFLEGDLIETTDDPRPQGELRDRRVALKAEEGSGEIILKFIDTKSFRNLGPQIKVKREDGFS